jgi:hypothetical protein
VARARRCLAVSPERRLQRQILGRIAHQEELGKQRDVGPGRRSARQEIKGQGLIAGDGADGGIGLDGGDDKTVGHGPFLA